MVVVAAAAERLHGHVLREPGPQEVVLRVTVAEVEHRLGRGTCRLWPRPRRWCSRPREALRTGGVSRPRQDVALGPDQSVGVRPLRSLVAVLRFGCRVDGEGIDQTGIDGEPLAVPDAGIGRRLDAGAGGFDETVAHDDRAFGNDLARGDHDANSGDGVNSHCLRSLGGRGRAPGEQGDAPRREPELSAHLTHLTVEMGAERRLGKGARRFNGCN